MLVLPAQGRSRRYVAQDLIQPAAQMPDLGARAERRERVQERLLYEVLRPPIRGEAPCRSVQLAAVALDDRREGTFVPGAREADQPLVGL